MRPSDIAAELAKAEIAAQRAIVIEPETDEILLAKNADVRGQVASTQKLLSALVIALEGHLNSAVTILPEDRACDPSFLAIQLGLSAYETYSRRDLLIGMLVGSANDAASALARDVAGSVPRFVERMNDLAADLGMSNSRFANPTGLPDERQFSTARDMAKLAEAVDATASLRKIVSLQRFSLLKNDGTAIEIRTTNRLLKSCSNCDGMKTGFTLISRILPRFEWRDGRTQATGSYLEQCPK